MAQSNVTPKIEYVDVPSISETYADTVRGLMYDGQSVRLELCVTRMDEPKDANGELTGKRQTACRVVLPLSAALDLSSQLGRMMATLAKRKAKQAQAVPNQAQAAVKQASTAAKPAECPQSQAQH